MAQGQGIISSLGIGSGLDTSSIIQQLVAAERQPRELRLDRAQKTHEAQVSAFGQLISSLDKLDESASQLSNLADARSVKVSDSSILSAQVKGGADTGSYFVEVGQLARAHSLASDEYTDADSVVGTGTLSVSAGDASVDINIDSSNNTLAGISQAINEVDAGVSAAVVDNGSGSQLLLTSDTTGVANSIEITVTDADGSDTDGSGLSTLAYNGTAQNMTETASARDAQLKVNGLAISRSTNQIDDVIDGVSLQLKTAQPGSETRVDVTRDTGSASDAVSGFVEALNKLNKQISSQTAFDQETGKSGVLQGDSAARALESRLRDGLVTQLGDGSFEQLVNLGITTSSDGGVEFDTATFESAMDSDFTGVTDLLDAAAEHFSGLVSDFGEQSGLLGNRVDSLKTRLEGIDERRLDLDQRMEQVEQRLRDKFASLDTLISDLQNTGNFLSRELANLPKPG